MLKIHDLYIESVNGIRELYLTFAPGLNILCGVNGIGKTTILDCISNSLRPKLTHTIRRNVHSEEGYWQITAQNNSHTERVKFSVHDNDFLHPKDREENPLFIESKEFISFDVSGRNSRGRGFTDAERYAGRSEIDHIKHWLYRTYFGQLELSEIRYGNFRIVQEIFREIDPNVNFGRLYIREREDYYGLRKFIEMTVYSPSGEIQIEHLSSGYKACMSILFGIIRIVERAGEDLQDFDGLILIDEIDLHLHPEWQSKIVKVLKWLVPNAQIIVTTHSPHIIQAAEPGEIIPLGIDENNKIFVRDLPISSEFGYQGWTIEEVLVHVMGLTNPMSDKFTSVLKEFNTALDEEDGKKVTIAFRMLQSMLNQQNPLSTLLSIQAGEFIQWGCGNE